MTVRTTSRQRTPTEPTEREDTATLSKIVLRRGNWFILLTGLAGMGGGGWYNVATLQTQFEHIRENIALLTQTGEARRSELETIRVETGATQARLADFDKRLSIIEQADAYTARGRLTQPPPIEYPPIKR